MKALCFILLLALIGCASNGEGIPKNVKTQVENFVDTASICFDGIQQELVWYNEFTEKGDTIIYRFDVPCQLNEDYKNRIMPMEYKAVVVNDSLVDVKQFWNLFNAWISEFPEPFNHKDLKYWTELVDFEGVKSVSFDKLEVVENEKLGWVEQYEGNIILEMDEGTMSCDSMIWCPKRDQVIILAQGKMIQFSETGDALSVLKGGDWEIDVINNSWVVHQVEMMQYYD